MSAYGSLLCIIHFVVTVAGDGGDHVTYSTTSWYSVEGRPLSGERAMYAARYSMTVMWGRRRSRCACCKLSLCRGVCMCVRRCENLS